MAFEWFVDLLLHLENQQSEYSLDRFLDIHLFMTGMKRLDLKNIGLQMALDLVHEKEERDLLTGLRTKLQAGRPDWKKVKSFYTLSVLFALLVKTCRNVEELDML